MLHVTACTIRLQHLMLHVTACTIRLQHFNATVKTMSVLNTYTMHIIFASQGFRSPWAKPLASEDVCTWISSNKQGWFCSDHMLRSDMKGQFKRFCLLCIFFPFVMYFNWFIIWWIRLKMGWYGVWTWRGSCKKSLQAC